MSIMLEYDDLSAEMDPFAGLSQLPSEHTLLYNKRKYESHVFFLLNKHVIWTMNHPLQSVNLLDLII